MANKPLFETSHWTMELLEKTWETIDKIAKEKYGLTYFEPQIEITTSDQLLHYLTMGALPFGYSHWSSGKAYTKAKDDYTLGKAGMAYEVIINSDPMICYIMENNTMTMQALVMAHAVVGHGSFFKNNLYFKEWTQPSTIIGFARFAKTYVLECEQKYGIKAVERILDAAHSLQLYGVNTMHRARTKSTEELAEQQSARIKHTESTYNPIWDTLPPSRDNEWSYISAVRWAAKAMEHLSELSWEELEQLNSLRVAAGDLPLKDWATRDGWDGDPEDDPDVRNRPGYKGYFTPLKIKLREVSDKSKFEWEFPEENLLYFIEKNAPTLKDWERELIRIVRIYAQYFYPQHLCKLMHEGWATFWHHTIMTDLWDEGYLTDGQYFEFLCYHTNVAAAYPDKLWFSSNVGTPNPYALGYRMFAKIKQACENPTETDYKELPSIVNTNWLETMTDIMETYNDESFIYQFLTSDVADDFGLAMINLDRSEDEGPLVTFTSTQDHKYLDKLRKEYSQNYSFAHKRPAIEVVDYKKDSDRSLHLCHTPTEGMALYEQETRLTMKYIHALWGKYPVYLRTIDKNGKSCILKREYK